MKIESKNCPMCESNEITHQESLKVSELNRLYQVALGISTERLFGDLKTIVICRCRNCDLVFFSPSISGSQEFYENLQKIDWYYIEEKEEFNFAAQYIKDGDDVLEIGAGNGSFAKIIPSNSYTGIEFSHQAIKFARSKGIYLVSQSIADYSKINKDKHDVVCNFQVLEHVCDVHNFISSSVNCLKPGGLMIISVPAADSFSRYVRNFHLDMPPHHLTRWTDLALANIAKHFNLELIVIHHENLQEIHKLFYATTIFSNAFFNFIGGKYSSIDLSLTSRIFLKISSMLGRFFCNGLISEDLLPRGLSVAAVYRKPEKAQ